MTPEELSALGRSLTSPAAALELSVLAASIAVAWLVAGWLRGRSIARSGSVLFGERLYDGALLPWLAFAFTLVANRALLHAMPPALMRIALPLLLSLAVIRLGVRVVRLAFPESRAGRMFERSLSWAVWVGVVLWITGVLPSMLRELDQVAWHFGATRVSLRAIVEGGFNAAVVLMLVVWASAAIEAKLIHGRTDNLSLRKIASNAIRSLLIFVGLLVALSAAGIDLTALSVFGGAIGVGLGLGLQKLASNYISGFVILAERSLRIGDVVKVDGFEGRIIDINTRSSIIRADSGRESIVPNELLVTQRVENASKADPSVMASTTLLLPHGTDFAGLREPLLGALGAIPRVLATPGKTSAAYLAAVRPEGLELTVQYWNGDPGNGQANLHSEVNLAILAVLKARGIELATPALGAKAPPAAA